jgi:hypothetical protein
MRNGLRSAAAAPFSAGSSSINPAFNSDTPYNVAIVELEEGPRLHTRIVGCSNDEIFIGMPVEVVFDRINDEVSLVTFEPRK